MATINDSDYQALVELMEAAMFQFSAATIDEAINGYAWTEPEQVPAVIADIDRLLNIDLDVDEVTAFVLRHSDYLINDDGRCTLEYIRRVLNNQK